MKNILRKVRNENFKDLMEQGEYKRIVSIKDIDCVDFRESKLYKYLSTLSDENINDIVVYMLAGRELSTYYGATAKIALKDYLEYYRTYNRIVVKEDAIEYVCNKSKRLNNYIDTVIKFMR